MDNTLAAINKRDKQLIPNELSNIVKTVTIKNTFEEKVNKIKIPQFFMGEKIDLLGIKEVLLNKNNLLGGFPLNKADIKLEILLILLLSYK